MVYTKIIFRATFSEVGFTSYILTHTEREEWSTCTFLPSGTKWLNYYTVLVLIARHLRIVYNIIQNACRFHYLAESLGVTFFQIYKCRLSESMINRLILCLNIFVFLRHAIYLKKKKMFFP